MYTAKVRIAPIGGAGSDSRAVVCSPFQNPHLDARLPNSFQRLVFIGIQSGCGSLLGWRLRESVNAATETTNHHWSAVSPFEDPLKMEIQ